LSYRMRVLHALWIWLKDSASDRAAGYIRTGMFTSDSFRKPFHVGLTRASVEVAAAAVNARREAFERRSKPWTGMNLDRREFFQPCRDLL